MRDLRSVVLGLLALAIFAITPSGSVRAATDEDWDQCAASEGDPAKGIAACTVIIDDDTVIAEDVARALSNRGFGHLARQEFDRARADFTAAIAREPGLPHPHCGLGDLASLEGNVPEATTHYQACNRIDPSYIRGATLLAYAYAWGGDYPKAIATLDRHLESQPGTVELIRARGHIGFDAGDYAQAAADLAQANELEPNGYAMLWRFLARARLGEDGSADLAAEVAQLASSEWPLPIHDVFLRRRPVADLANAGSNPDQRCEAAFYAAHWQLLEGGKDQARALLQQVVETCPKNNLEYGSAIAELKRLDR